MCDVVITNMLESNLKVILLNFILFYALVYVSYTVLSVLICS